MRRMRSFPSDDPLPAASRALRRPDPHVDDADAVLARAAGPRLGGILAWDILRSNIAVAWAIVSRHPRTPGFVEIPLELQDRNGLALLAIMVTATPGTAWIEYRAKTGTLLIHAFDMVEEGHWRDLIKNRYEALLMEIFE